MSIIERKRRKKEKNQEKKRKCTRRDEEEWGGRVGDISTYISRGHLTILAPVRLRLDGVAAWPRARHANHHMHGALWRRVVSHACELVHGACTFVQMHMAPQLQQTHAKQISCEKKRRKRWRKTRRRNRRKKKNTKKKRRRRKKEDEREKGGRGVRYREVHLILHEQWLERLPHCLCTHTHTRAPHYQQKSNNNDLHIWMYASMPHCLRMRTHTILSAKSNIKYESSCIHWLECICQICQLIIEGAVVTQVHTSNMSCWHTSDLLIAKMAVRVGAHIQRPMPTEN